MRSVIIACLLALSCAQAFASQPTLQRRSTLGAGLAQAQGTGAIITAVAPNSPAARAGLRAGDTVMRIGGHDVASPTDLAAAVARATAGRGISLAILRDGAPHTLQVTLVPAAMENDAQIETIYGSVSVDNSLRRALITLPRNARERLPAMLIVGGIGCYSIDNANADDVYRRLAYDLGRRGIVVMRLEKSGVGDSQGPPCALADLRAETRSYVAAAAALAADRHVDPRRVFVLGHSIGSIAAPEIAARMFIAGLISAESLGRTWIEYELINTRRQLELSGATPGDVDATMALKAACVDRALIQNEPMAHLTAELPECAGLVSLPASQEYMHQLTDVNVGRLWTSFDAPALIIYGTSDFVADEADSRRLAGLVNGVHPGRADLTLLAGMDHFLTHAQSQAASWRQSHDENAPTAAYFDGFSTTVGDWICARARCRGQT